MKRVRFPDETHRLEAWLSANGPTRKPSNQWLEWKALSSFVRLKQSAALFGRSFLAVHTDCDGTQGQPDFIVHTSAGATVAVEVSAAASGNDIQDIREKWALPVKSMNPRGQELFDNAGVSGDPDVGWFIDDLISRIAAKSKKPYACGAVLICPIRSYAALADFSRAVAELEDNWDLCRDAGVEKFRAVASFTIGRFDGVFIENMNVERLIAFPDR